MVVMRLGRTLGVKGPGAALVLPFIDSATKVDIRTSRIEIPSIQLITNDRGLVEISIAMFVKVVDPLISCCSLQDKDQVFSHQFFQIAYMLAIFSDSIRHRNITAKSRRTYSRDICPSSTHNNYFILLRVNYSTQCTFFRN